MEEQDIYTITIVRNIGIPISFTVKRWKVFFILGALVVFAALLLVGSIDYIFLRSKTDDLSKQLELSQDKVKVYRKQIAKTDHDRYWSDPNAKTNEISAVKSDILEQPEFSTEGIWITNKPTISEKDYQEGRAVEVNQFRASVKGDVLRLSIKIKNISNPPQPVGGHLCLTLVNQDQSPPIYKSVEGVELGDNGFPLTYKKGSYFHIQKQRDRSSYAKFNLTKVNEYYTDAMIFLFTYQGRLLSRHKVALKKEIFLE